VAPTGRRRAALDAERRHDALDAAGYARAARLLAERDPRFAPVISWAGRCRLPEARTRAPFASMVRALVSQQLSGRAAETIYGRVVALAGGPDQVEPGVLLSLDPLALRQAGLSRAKASYLVDLAEHVVDGRLNLHDLDHRDDDAVIEAITAVKGFGRWSAEMFLIFRLNRSDIFPVGDLGIVKGMQRFLAMKSRPSVRTMLRAAEPWRPYRSVAAWYLWRLTEMPSRDGKPK
jgi:DNA-3-methyladenine glycosylase II